MTNTATDQPTTTPADAENKTTALATSEPAAARIEVRMGVAPQTIDEAWRLAQVIAKSELVPKHFQNKPADVMVAIQHGMELGLAPLQALSSIAVVNGRACVWGDALLAIVIASAQYQDHDEYFEVVAQGELVRRDGLTATDLAVDTTAAVCSFMRRGRALPTTRRFTIAQAKKAKLLTKDGPWQTYPDRMLQMRARGLAARDAFPDVLRGIRTAEEVRDTPTDDTPTPSPLREVRRVSDTRTANAVDAEPIEPARELVTLEPAAVLRVEQFLGGYTVTLSGGVVIDVTDKADALDLEKFINSKHRVVVTVTKIAGVLQLQSFSIAE
jgi:RecT family